MTLRPCPHTPEVKQSLQSGQWPHSCAPELRTHADACRACSELLLVSQAFLVARAVSVHGAAARIPPPGVLWWKAQLRRRNEALQRIHKPIVSAQIFALATSLLVAVGILLSQIAARTLRIAGVKDWLASLAQSRAFHLQSLWSGGFSTAVKPDVSLAYLAPGFIMLALLSGLIAYLATHET